MRVDVDQDLAFLLATLGEQEIPIPKELLLDLMEGQLGSLNSVAALASVTAALVEKQPPEKVSFDDAHEMLFRATRDALDELEADWRHKRKEVVEEWRAEHEGPQRLAKRRASRAARAAAKRGKRAKRRAA
jgi:hypothetical protein